MSPYSSFERSSSVMKTGISNRKNRLKNVYYVQKSMTRHDIIALARKLHERPLRE